MGGCFTTPYFRRDAQWVTPTATSGGKLGVSRRWALEFASVKEAAVRADSLTNGEVVWLSSAVGGFERGVIVLGEVNHEMKD